MKIFKRVVSIPFLVALFILERISKPAWSFLAGCFLFYFGFSLINSNVEETNIMDAMRVIFGNAIWGLVAIQTLPQMFLDIFND